MAVKSPRCFDKQRSKDKVKTEKEHMNDSFFLRKEKQPEIKKYRVDRKTDKKMIDFPQYLLFYRRNDKPSNTATEDNNAKEEKSYISNFHAGPDLFPLSNQSVITVTHHG